MDSLLLDGEAIFTDRQRKDPASYLGCLAKDRAISSERVISGKLQGLRRANGYPLKSIDGYAKSHWRRVEKSNSGHQGN